MLHSLVALVTLLALLLFFWMGIRVSSARQRHAVTAPATTGHPEFERHFRVQANTLEGLVLFLPSMWLFAIFVGSDYIAAGLGVVWIIGRIMYMMSYVKEPTKRGPGFGIQALATMVLMLGSLGWVVWRIVQGVM
jgi:glutathione S-transferase